MRLVAVVAVHAALASCACVNVSPVPSFCTNQVVSVCLARIAVKPLRFHAHMRFIGHMDAGRHAALVKLDELDVAVLFQQ